MSLPISCPNLAYAASNTWFDEMVCSRRQCPRHGIATTGAPSQRHDARLLLLGP